MKHNKPDLLLVLAVLFSLGFALSAYTHASREDKTPMSAATAAIVVQR